MINSSVMQALRSQGLDEPCIKVLKDTFRDSMTTIKLCKKTELTPNKKGFRQSGTMSLKLFTVCLEIFKKSEWDNIRTKVDWDY